MPKVVDNYVFDRRIGSGQYGDVFKGHNRLTMQDVAIKTIKRENIKGKFMQLLENEIKVLKTCDNRNIIKLYDIKKTANNFYLIIEYCNEGDLSVSLKKKKTFPEDEAIEYFVQIVNAFKTLVKNKVMHRDFKLANILLHDGEIKIADFGFSKLLTEEEFTETMLGSPLNMAPEVLGGGQYNSKADIWSIGVVFYEMLFGTPPYKASNMVDLINNIKNKPLQFPKNIKICSHSEDVLRKMLVVDPKKRIDWEVLFEHPILVYLDDRLSNQLQNALTGNQQDIEMNVSRFYLRNNMVVEHPREIEKKENVNNYAYNVVNGKSKEEFKGEVIKRETQRKKSVQGDREMYGSEPKSELDKDSGTNNAIQDEQTEKEKQIRQFKRNSAYLLHRRNIYVFLASTAEEAMEMGKEVKIADVIGYLLIRKLLAMLEWLKQRMDNKKEFEGLDYWDAFTKEKDYRDIRSYVEKQYDVFKVFYDSVHNRVKEKLKMLDPETQEVLQNKHSANNEKVYQKMIREYIKSIEQLIENRAFKSASEEKKYFVHLSKIVDCLDVENNFQFEKNGNSFNFHQYYESPERMDFEVFKKQVRKKVSYV